jgi:hypothetical protein
MRGFFAALRMAAKTDNRRFFAALRMTVFMEETFDSGD